MNFLGMGPMELMLILVLALIVFGPGKLPEIAGQVGKAVRDLRRATTDLSSEFNRTLSLELEEKKEAEQAAATQTGPAPAPAAVQPVEAAPVAAASVPPATETTTVPPSADTTPAVPTAEHPRTTVETPPAPSAEEPSTTVAAPIVASDSTSATTGAETPSSAEVAAPVEAETSSSSWEQRWNPPAVVAEPGSESAPVTPVDATAPVAASAEAGSEPVPKKSTRTRTPRKSTPAGPVADTPTVEDIVDAGGSAETAIEEAAAPPAPAKPRKPRAPRRKTDANLTAAVKEVADPARSS
jgi:sec-independent protein translocase protein TatB